MNLGKTLLGRVGASLVPGVLLMVFANGAAAQDRDPSLQSPGYLWKALLSSGSDPAASEEEGQGKKWYDRVTVGAGIKTDFRSFENGANSGANANDAWAKGFQVNDARLYFNGQITDTVAATLNVQMVGNDFGAVLSPFFPVANRVIDAIAQLNFGPEFHIWIGQMLPPSDRSNLDGPYYTIAWDFPFVDLYPTNGFGRQMGIQAWGEFNKSMVKYYIGVFDGLLPGLTGEDNLLIAGRIQVNLLDPEEGFYAADTYFGEKTLLCIGIAGQWQAKSAGNVVLAGDARDLAMANVDVLFERKFKELADVTLTLEAELFGYDTGGYTTLNAFGNFLATGEGYLFTVAALWPEKIGWGKVQPFFRYQAISDVGGKVVGSLAHNTITQMDFGLNYFISGFNARLALVYSAVTNPGGVGAFAIHSEINQIVIGAQVQF